MAEDPSDFYTAVNDKEQTFQADVAEARYKTKVRETARQLDLEELYGEIAHPPLLSAPEAAVYYRGKAGKELIADCMPASGISTLYSPSGEGKTLLVLYRALCLANGKDFFGHPINQRVASLIVGFEDVHDLHLRLYCMADRHGMDVTGVYIVGEPMMDASPQSVDMFIKRYLTDENLKRIEDESGLPLRVVTVDTQRHVIRGSSNDDLHTAEVTLMLRRLAERVDGVAESITHTPAADETRIAGNGEQKGSRSFTWRVGGNTLFSMKTRTRESDRTGVPIGYYLIESHPIPTWLMEPGMVSTQGVIVETTATAAGAAATEAAEQAEERKKERTERQHQALCEALLAEIYRREEAGEPPIRSGDEASRLLKVKKTRVVVAKKDLVERGLLRDGDGFHLVSEKAVDVDDM